MREVHDEQQNVVLQPYATYLNGPRGVEYRQDASGVRSWYLYDGLGSVIAEVDEGNNQSGIPQITGTHASDVYGNTFESTGTSASSHKFCGGLGHTTDSDTGLVYMRARYYDPAVGRFVSEDPSGNGANWYAYCGGNPISWIDLDGCKTISDILGEAAGKTFETLGDEMVEEGLAMRKLGKGLLVGAILKLFLGENAEIMGAAQNAGTMIGTMLSALGTVVKFALGLKAEVTAGLGVGALVYGSLEIFAGNALKAGGEDVACMFE